MSKLIAIMCGRVQKNPNGTWSSAGYGDFGEPSSAPGSKARVEAGAVLFEKEPDNIIAVLGGGRKHHDRPKVFPALSSVAKRELVDMGVPSGRIITETASRTTYEQLLSLAKIAEKRRAKKILIVSNEYHLSRIKAMLRSAPGLGKAMAKYSPKPIAAEDLLAPKNRRYAKIIRAAYSRPEMKQFIAKEREGARQVANGTYDYNTSVINQQTSLHKKLSP